MKNIIIDAGPLIALFNKKDKYHKKILNFLKEFSGTLFTTWPVITEVTHLLSSNINIQIDFLEWIRLDAIEIVEIKKEKLSSIIALTKKYRDIPMDLADASLVLIAEEKKIKSNLQRN